MQVPNKKKETIGLEIKSNPLVRQVKFFSSNPRAKDVLKNAKLDEIHLVNQKKKFPYL